MTPTDSSHHHDDHLYSNADLHNEDVAHEHSDVNVRALLVFAAGMVAVTAMVHFSMWGLFAVFERQAAANDPVLSPLARPAGELPKEPRLLTDEPQNLQRFRESLAEGMKGIEDAKKRLLQQGLPVRANAPSDAWLGLHSQAWGEASGGRRIPITPGAMPAGSAPPAREAPAPTAPAAPPKSGGH
jgi:hypothetical protein